MSHKDSGQVETDVTAVLLGLCYGMLLGAWFPILRNVGNYLLNDTV